MYEYKSQDVFNLASFIGAEVKQKGNELFFKYCPNCKGGGHDKETFSIESENLLNSIKFRRSVRRFKDKKVEKEKIAKISE